MTGIDGAVCRGTPCDHRKRCQCPYDGMVYIVPAMVCDISDLNAELGSGYKWWYNFYEFRKLAMDELDVFDYGTYQANGFKKKHLGDFTLKLEKKPED